MDDQVIANWKIKNKKIPGTQIHGTRVPWKNSSGTWVPWTWVLYMVLEFMELEIQKKKKNPKSMFAITRYSKNRVIDLKLDFYKIEFQNRDVFLISLENWTKYWIFCVKGAFAHFGQRLPTKFNC